MEVAKPELLYVSPVIPALTGNGLAMRAGMVLEILTRSYSVSLVVIALYPSAPNGIPEAFQRMCRRTAVVFPFPIPKRRSRLTFWRRAETNGGSLSELKYKFRDMRWDVIHVFRMAALPYAGSLVDLDACRKAGVRRQLDMDDIESVTHGRLAELYRHNGDLERAEMEASAAESSRTREQKVCLELNRIYVCSGKDRHTLSEIVPGARISVLPNAVRLPGCVQPSKAEGPFRFLFVGTLGYYPNFDAVRRLCHEIVPAIREKTRRPFEVCVIGTGAPPRLREMVAQAGLSMIGEVPDMQPWYERAGAVVSPIYAGGGTRIKILEAWSHARPVVTTSLGIEGIAAVHECHALIADSSVCFAAQCVRLMEDAELSGRLASNGRAMVLQSYTADAVAAVFREDARES